MRDRTAFEQVFKIKGGDFINAGESSIKIRNILKDIGIEANIIRRVAIAAYEAEMNVVMYAQRGLMKVIINAKNIILRVEDKGPGIEDIELAMKPGYSTATEEVREMGFGAGMGLPNIKKNSDHFDISSVVGKSTRLEMVFNLNGTKD